jgi:hypothetical protein
MEWVGALGSDQACPARRLGLPRRGSLEFRAAFKSGMSRIQHSAPSTVSRLQQSGMSRRLQDAMALAMAEVMLPGGRGHAAWCAVGVAYHAHSHRPALAWSCAFLASPPLPLFDSLLPSTPSLRLTPPLHSLSSTHSSPPLPLFDSLLPSTPSLRLTPQRRDLAGQLRCA